MANDTLEEFIGVNRDELISRCRVKVSKRSPPPAVDVQDDHGVPRLLDQVVEELRHGPSIADEITKTATKHGRKLLLEGFTVGQVVHGYGDVCQSVTELAVELAAPISADDFRTLNRCLDDAIAGAVTEHARDQTTTPDGGSQELRNLANTALVAFEVLQGGTLESEAAPEACCSAASSPYALSLNAPPTRAPSSLDDRRPARRALEAVTRPSSRS